MTTHFDMLQRRRPSRILRCRGNVDNVCTSVILPFACATMFSATGFNFDKFSVPFWRERPPLFAFRAPDSSKNAIMGRRMPRNDAIRWRTLSFFLPNGGFVFWASNAMSAVAEEHVRLRHHSSPQQIWQRPPLWFGLHLSPWSPWTLPLSGATWAASRPILRCMAFKMAVCTQRDRLPLVVFCAKKSK